MSRRLKIGLAVTVGLVVLGAASVRLLGLRGIASEAAPYPDPSHAPLDALLRAHVRDGRVDYVSLKTDARLERYVATLAGWGPRSTPDAFPSEAARLAYQLNAYNALVLFAVARAWPIASVHDVRGPIEPKAGFGFFWAQHFRLDGRWINLYDLEHEVLRAGFEDARIHAAIVCASASCPRLAAAAYRPETVDAQLDLAMRAFASAPYVRVDDEGERIVLNAIYDWFAEDFAAEARRRAAGRTALDGVVAFADPETRAALTRARRDGYAVTYAAYDWSVNAAGP